MLSAVANQLPCLLSEISPQRIESALSKTVSARCPRNSAAEILMSRHLPRAYHRFSILVDRFMQFGFGLGIIGLPSCG